MEWIRVEDRLPEDSYSTRVLAYGIPTCGTCGTRPRIQFCTFSQEKGFEFGEYDCGLNATHWMPLPEPPHG